MGLTSTANAVSKLSNLAEKLYQRVEATREQVQEVRETVNDTNDRVAELEDELAEQRAVLDAVAVENGVDVADVLDSDDAADAETGPADE